MITTPARLTACPRCRHPILACHVEGVTVRADPTPLDPAGELAALLDRRATYDLTHTGVPRSPHLGYRYDWHIRAPRRHPVIADHCCPPFSPRTDPLPPPLDLRTPLGSPPPDEPPF